MLGFMRMLKLSRVHLLDAGGMYVGLDQCRRAALLTLVSICALMSLTAILHAVVSPKVFLLFFLSPGVELVKVVSLRVPTLFAAVIDISTRIDMSYLFTMFGSVLSMNSISICACLRPEHSVRMGSLLGAQAK